jgi:hypothetical protein
MAEVTRTLKIDFSVVDVAQWGLVRTALKIVSAAKRSASWFMSGVLQNGGKIEQLPDGGIRILPSDTPYAKLAHEAVGGGDLRQHITNMISGCLDAGYVDGIIGSVSDWYFSKDGEFKASKGYLMLNGARRPPDFSSPIVDVRSKGEKQHFFVDPGNPHRVTWVLRNRLRAESFSAIELRIGRMDAWSWSIWKKIVSGELPMCDPVYLYLRRIKPDRQKYNGPESQPADQSSAPKRKCGSRRWRLSGAIPFKMQVSDKLADPDRLMEVYCSEDQEPGNFFQLRISYRTKGRPRLTDIKRLRQLDVGAALVILDQNSCRREALETGMRRCALPKVRQAYLERSDRLAKARTKSCRYFNHGWTRAILNNAQSWRCGHIVVYGVPDSLMGRSWPWHEFKNLLGYKAKESGIKVEWPEIKREELDRMLAELAKQAEEDRAMVGEEVDDQDERSLVVAGTGKEKSA